MTGATKPAGGAPLLWLVAFLSRPLIAVAFRPRVLGREHLPRRGGFVVAPNHLSGFDVWAVGYSIGRRRLRNMGKNQLFRRPILGPVVRALGAFPARDGVDGIGGTVAAAALARRGDVVAIFPEGARRRPDRVHRPRSGAARTALDAGVPLVPAAIRGTDGWRRLQRWHVAFGQPVALDDLQAEAPPADAREATDRLWESVQSLEALLESRA